MQAKLYKRGHWYSKLNQHDACIKDNKSVIKLNHKSKWYTLAFIRIARSLNKGGDFLLAAKNFEFAEEQLKKSDDYNKLIDLYINSYDTYSKIRTQKAGSKLLMNLKTADSLADYNNVTSSKKYTIKRALGSFHSIYKHRDIDKGQFYLNQALDIALKEKDSLGIAIVYNDLGRLYDESNSKNSLTYNTLALTYCPKDNFDLKSTIEANFGLNNAHLGNYKLGINQLQQALLYITGSRFDQLSINDKEKHISNNLQNNNLWSIIRWIGEGYDKKHEKTEDKKDLDSALVYYKLTDYTFDQYALKSKVTNSKLLWRQEASEAYSRSIRAFVKAEAYEEALYFMEKNKGLLLQKETAKIKAFKEKQLPIHLVQKERSLQVQLQSNTEAAILPAILDSLEQVQQQIRTLLPSLNILEKQSDILGLKDIQAELKVNQAIVEYHISTDDEFGIYPNPNTGYGLVITKDTTSLFALKDLSSIKASITSLLEKLSGPQQTQNEVKTFNTNTHHLYNSLFPDFIKPLIEGKSLTIIPDNYLSQIPFEVLTVSDSTPNDYLILHHEINYKYSYSFHHAQSKDYQLLENEFVAFAPVNFQSDQLANLQNSAREIETIDNYFNGASYIGAKATKANFIDQLGKGSIVHLATHANAADSITPWISLYDEKVSLDELSNYQNEASLVVLSACNTTSGEILQGEGTMSLARAFFYGGTQSTLSSLWQIDDKATSTLMNEFYKNLSEGVTKSAGIRNAKLTYLKNHSGSELSPYYWSSFILIGDTSPIPTNNYTVYYYILIGIALLIGFILLSRNLSRSRREA